MKAKQIFRRIMCLVLIGLMVLTILAGCGEKKEEENNNPTQAEVQAKTENGGTFVIELYPEYAPVTVENFVKLVEEGFYDGLTFHRISDGFMAQGGGYYPPGIDGEKKPADSIYGEFANNGFAQNTLKHTKGVISMARTYIPDSASSEFFIMLGEATWLDGDYAAFGQVIEGMEVIDVLEKIELKDGFAADGGKATIPVNPVIIKSAILLEEDGGNPKVQMEIEY